MQVVGVDEVGRGCLAGPLLVVAALASGQLPIGLDDSKKLSKAKRSFLADELAGVCRFGEGWVSSLEINELGLSGAMRLGVQRALSALEVDYDKEIILDGHINYCPRGYKNVHTLIKADSLVPIVSAASIYAKVMRDKYMTEQAILHPGYGFEEHVGYGTTKHLKAIKDLGVVENLHRLSFGPVKAIWESS